MTTRATLLTSEDRGAFRDWVEDNPLRRWRYAHLPKQLPILETAQRMGVSMSMIQMWERGVHRPGPLRMEMLARYLGDDVAEQWSRWAARRPT